MAENKTISSKYAFAATGVESVIILSIKLFSVKVYNLFSNCFILFSIAGIPPLVGFYSKFYVFIAAIKSGYYFVVLIAAIFSVIASMYYIRLIKLMFFKTFVHMRNQFDRLP